MREFLHRLASAGSSGAGVEREKADTRPCLIDQPDAVKTAFKDHSGPEALCVAFRHWLDHTPEGSFWSDRL